MRSLARDLGVPAVPTVARTKQGLAELVAAVAAVIAGETATAPARAETPAELGRALDELVPMIEEAAPGLPSARWVALRLLDGDHKVRQALLSGELTRLVAEQSAAAERGGRLMAIEGAQ